MNIRISELPTFSGRFFAAAMAAMSLVFLSGVPAANAASSISIDSVPPPGCQLSNTQIDITGQATADAPPGQLQQYAVDVDWGDGDSDTVLAQGSFGSGQGIAGPIPFAGSHTYSVPGTYHIVATIYHQNINGQDNVDSGENSFIVCIVSPLSITKTADTSFTRAYTWSVDKTADQTALLLADGELFNVNYGVTANATPADSAWAVSGNITIGNPVGNPTLSVQNVTDTLSIDGAATVTCPGGLPQQLAAGGSLVCTYTKSLGAATNQTNTASVDVNENVLDASSAPVAVTFGAPTTVTDECATFTDTNAAGPQGVQKCAGVDPLPANWNYSVSFGKDAGAQVALVCGLNPAYLNTVSFLTNDTQTAGQDSWSVTPTVNCPTGGGCTLTQGYWKTHNDSFKGGAPTDTNWANLGASKELTMFYSSGKTWFALFWTPPAGGNVYIQLAHQYMAAKLNVLNGAGTPPAVAAALAGAEAWFPGKTPSTNLSNALKNQAKGWASTLGSYNEGNAGVPHCSEQ